ncbi:3-carboxy-cis,cis-muconate cycloisomerase [Larkinella soli]|uniref:3-carboxy-cis,cis-muconate cycloisomerase n=1 Tax=Larkinella soli TaxID=1770527 RepID=UPI000FFC82E5|nr:3-carboxy-cis,cis-muconate cycloisomerase [Larkinella soli]
MSLYTHLFYSSELQPLLSDEAFLSRMLRFEAALARAQAREGLIPAKSADAIAACCEAARPDLERLRQEVAPGGNAAIPLVKQLTEQVAGRDPEAAGSVHLGATSQDVVDTAMTLTIKAFREWLEPKLQQLETLLTDLTRTHRQTVMAGRTLLQQARPITFGLKTAYWLEAVRRSRQRLEESRPRVEVLQLGGAVGSGNAFLTAEVLAETAAALGLRPAAPWHSQRDRPAEWAANLGILTGSLGKIARDVSLLMQTEIGEVLEGKAAGKGGSSTMPHKRNPVHCAAILANAGRTPQLVATLLAAMPQENERSAGGWHAEWEPLTDLMQLTGGAVDRSIELLADLEVDPARMRQNLEITGGLIYAEAVSLALAPRLGKTEAHRQVEMACETAITQGKHLKAVLAELDFALPDPDALFRPENAVGRSLEIIDSLLNPPAGGSYQTESHPYSRDDEASI